MVFSSQERNSIQTNNSRSLPLLMVEMSDQTKDAETAVTNDVKRKES